MLRVDGFVGAGRGLNNNIRNDASGTGIPRYADRVAVL